MLTIIKVLQFSCWREFCKIRVSLHSLYGGTIFPCSFLLERIAKTRPRVVRFLLMNFPSVSTSNIFSAGLLMAAPPTGDICLVLFNLLACFGSIMWLTESAFLMLLSVLLFGVVASRVFTEVILLSLDARPPMLSLGFLKLLSFLDRLLGLFDTYLL